MDAKIRQNTATFKAARALGLAGLLWAGCTAGTYSGPVHGLTSDGTAESINLQGHRLLPVPLKPSQPIVITYEDTTKFWKNGTPIHADEEKPGDPSESTFT